MFLKSLVLSVAAAVLAPIIGLAMFFMVDSYDSGQPTMISATPSLKAEQTTDSGQTEISERFVPQEPWRASAAIAPLDRKPASAQARWSTEPGTWQTTVSCPGETPLPEEGPCPSLEIGKVPKTRMADIVLKPPTFAERNSLGAPKPIFSADLAKPAIADPAPVLKKATDTQQIARGTVRSRTSRMENVRVNSRRASSKSWMNKVWGLPN